MRIPKRSIAAAFIFAATASFSAEVSCDLDGLLVGKNRLPFGESVEIVARDPKPQSWSPLTTIHDGTLFVVDQIGGQEIDTPLEILAFGVVQEKLRDGHLFRLEGHFGDAFSFGSEISASFKATRSEYLGKVKETEQAAPPKWGELDGKSVSLEGHLWSLNDAWRFECGNSKLHLGNATGRARSFPGDWHGRRVTVQGTLRRQLRFSPLFGQDSDGLKLWPVIFDAVVRLAGEPSPAEPSDDSNRFRQLSPMSPVRSQGVFDLLPERFIFKNLFGDETTALSYSLRNRPWLLEIVRSADAKALDVLASRMNDPSRDAALRVIEAGMLAARNDPRGRRFLGQCLAKLKEPDRDALFVLGEFHEWAKDKEVDLAWAEDLAMRCLNEAPLHTVTFSSIPELLVMQKSARGIERIAALIRDQAWWQESKRIEGVRSWDKPDEALLRALLKGDPESVSNDLLISLFTEFEDGAWAQSWIGRELLERDAVEVLDQLLPKIVEEWWDIYFRDHAGPRILAELKRLTASLEGEAAEAVDMVVLHHSGTAVEVLIQRLEDPTTPIESFNRIPGQLGQFKDGKRAAVPMARFIHERILPSGKEPDFRGSLILYAIRMIGESSEDEAIGEMITLLGSDFSLLSSEVYPAEHFRETIADQLAQMTGVSSFGTNVSQWQTWTWIKEQRR